MSLAIFFGVEVLLSGCGAAYHRDKLWNNTFGNANGYQGYVIKMLNEPGAEGWKTKYYSDLTTNGVTEDQKVSDRNRVINAYMVLADVAYFKFSGGYNDQIAKFEIGADMVNLGLTAASAVTPPAALLGAAATGSLGVQHSLEKNALNSQTRFAITNRMGAIRDRQRAVILKRELEPVSCPTPAATNPNSSGIVSDQCYSLEDGMRDVNEYFNLGTINQALADINTSTGQIVQQNRATLQGSTQTTAAATITSTTNADFTAGTARSFAVNTSGSPSPTLTEMGALPAGLTFADRGDGTATLSGTPAAGSAGNYTATITAHNGVGADATQTLTIIVH
ncbi:MAG: Ig domain-containing protein [Terriglobales bacterium]